MPKRSPITVRPATTRDVPALLPLMAAFNAHEGIAHRPRRLERALRALLRDQKLGVVLIAWDSSRRAPLGYAVLSYGYDLEFAGPDAFVTELYVDPAHRRRGLAESLLRALVRRMQRQRVTALHLVVRPTNRRARQLYAKVGFALVPRVMMTRVLVAK